MHILILKNSIKICFSEVKSQDGLRIFHISFIQSNNSLCLLVSEEKIFFNLSQSETRNVHGDHVFCSIEMKRGNLIEDLP